MKQTASVLSTYTADVSGVCSALYELGGMTVMHDPSGCNSTYNTHDEPRWYDMDSMIYISALSELDAVMGNDEKFIGDVVEAGNSLHPRFIAICGSPIPMMVGTDFTGIARMIERRTKIPTFAIKTNGMHSYLSGAGEALAQLARRFCSELPEQKLGRKPAGNHPSVNLLGVTPLDFSVVGNVEAMELYFEEHEYPVVSTWAMDSTWEECMRAGEAQVNVVVSLAGLPLAKVLQEKYQTPYVMGVPIGEQASARLLDQIDRAAEGGRDPLGFLTEGVTQIESPKTCIIGEPVWAMSLRRALVEAGIMKNIQVISPFPETGQYLGHGDVCLPDEEDIAKEVRMASYVIADPLYKRILPKDDSCRLLPFPHEGYSGRIFRGDLPQFIGECGVNHIKKQLEKEN